MEHMNQDMGGKCENCGCHNGNCSCPHHKAVPVAIILIAVTFLLGNWGILTASAVSVIWPILVLIIGGTKLMGSSCKCCS